MGLREYQRKKVGEYLVVEDLPGLIGLVQFGILEVHTWSSTIDRLEQPDRLVFDLDPDEGLPWASYWKARQRLTERRLKAVQE